MEVGLEFLHSDEDIAEFVTYLYEQGFSLCHAYRHMRGVVMDPMTAVHELQHDLHTGFSSYYIGDAENHRILVMTSCDSQSHPSKLGRQGRSAGVIGHIDKENANEKELMRLLRNYFRRNYKFQRYNGTARMSCHFGPHYLQMETEFFSDPRVEDLCAGYLSVTCPAGRAEMEKERALEVLRKLDVQNVKISGHPYWGEPAFVRLQIPFLYYAPSFNVDGYSAVFSALTYDGRIRFGSSNVSFRFYNTRLPDALPDQPEANCVELLLQRPWNYTKIF